LRAETVLKLTHKNCLTSLLNSLLVSAAACCCLRLPAACGCLLPAAACCSLLLPAA